MDAPPQTQAVSCAMVLKAQCTSQGWLPLQVPCDDGMHQLFDVRETVL